MRRWLVGTICVLFVASTASVGASPTGTNVRHTCGAKAMKFYFWPQGHNAVPSVKFPPYAPPHLEAYTAKGVYDAFVDAAGQSNYAKACKSVPDLPARWTAPPAKRKTITTTTVVNCVFPAVADLKASKGGGGGLFIVTAGHTAKLVLVGSLKATGSKLTFDSRFCRAAPAPAQATPTKYAFSGVTASFNLHGAAISYNLSGEVCGDPATTPWKISGSINNGATQVLRPAVILPAGTPTEATAIVFKDSAGNEVAKASLQLTFGPGPPPTMSLAVVAAKGDVTNIQVGGSPAAVSATPVSAC